MKYHRIDNRLFIKNRAQFTSKMKANSLAVFNSNDTYPISADSTMPFQQHRDILYLSGVDQEESVLVLFPDCPNEDEHINKKTIVTNFIVFIILVLSD